MDMFGRLMDDEYNQESRFTYNMAQLPHEVRLQIGHQFDDFIKDCTLLFQLWCCSRTCPYISRESFLRLDRVQSTGQIWLWRCKLLMTAPQLGGDRGIFEQATSVYGIRRYRRGAVLYSHLDRFLPDSLGFQMFSHLHRFLWKDNMTKEWFCSTLCSGSTHMLFLQSWI